MKSGAWPGLVAKLRINDNDLHEYDDEDADAGNHNTDTKYVEAVSGANFTVELWVKPHFRYKTHALQCSLLLDDVFIRSSIYDAEKYPDEVRSSVRGVYRCLHGEHVIEKFAFAELETSMLFSLQI